MIQHVSVATIVAVAVIHAVAAKPAAASQPSTPAIRVQLTSGRTFEACVSGQTNEKTLWLAYRTRSAELLRPVDWKVIASAQFRGDLLSSDELRQRFLNDPTAFLASQAKEGEATKTIENISPAKNAPTSPLAQVAAKVLFNPPRVATVRFDAHLANWDGDVDADGLAVQIVAVDKAGCAIPVKGHVQVELYGSRKVAFQNVPHSRGHRIDRLGYWTKQLVPEMIHADGTWIKLPFQADHPELDSRIAAAGLVHVKLIVPGQGVFEASLDNVRVRPFSPLRDQLESKHGRRFLPNERTSRAGPAS